MGLYARDYGSIFIKINRNGFIWKKRISTNNFDDSRNFSIISGLKPGFIGLLLLFGFTKKNDIEIQEIWSPDSLHHSGFATSAMQRNRFTFIASCLTFDGISTRDQR